MHISCCTTGRGEVGVDEGSEDDEDDDADEERDESVNDRALLAILLIMNREFSTMNAFIHRFVFGSS